MSFARWRYELRVVGPVNLLLPVVVVGCFAAVAVIAFIATGNRGGDPAQSRFDAARILLFLFEAIMPLVIGFVTATLVTHDPARELHMSLPQSFAQTIERRLSGYLLWTACLTLLICIVATISGFWIAPQGQPQAQLVWLAPLLWNSAAGALVALSIGGPAGAGAVLAFFTMGQAFLGTFFLAHDALHPFFLLLTNFTLPAGPGVPAPPTPYWLANRLTLLALALAMLAVVGLLLRRNESLLGSEQ